MTNRYANVVDTVVPGNYRELNIWELASALEDIDERLSSLEEEAKLDATSNKPREPGLYLVKTEDGIYYVRLWSRQGRWKSQSGYELGSKKDPVWVGSRIQELEE